MNNINKKNITGIYKIENKINQKIYIGQSTDIYKRWKQHKEQLKQNKHCNKKLQNDWNLYEEKNFNWTIVEVCIMNKILLYESESKWIKYYNSIKNGYNKTSLLDYNFTNKENILKMKKDLFNIMKEYEDKSKFYLSSISNYFNLKTRDMMVVFKNITFDDEVKFNITFNLDVAYGNYDNAIVEKRDYDKFQSELQAVFVGLNL